MALVCEVFFATILKGEEEGRRGWAYARRYTASLRLEPNGLQRRETLTMMVKIAENGNHNGACYLASMLS